VGEGPYHTFTGTDVGRLPSAAAFRQAYVERFPESSVYTAEGYDAVMLLAAALQRVPHIDRGSVLNEVRRIEYAGATGSIAFDANGDRVNAPVGLYQVRDGRMTYLGEVDELVSRSGAPA
jgi:branched-chain amino acid transport system substrate-binding protein